MQQRHTRFGLALATLGALVLSPDTLFMRWTEMEGGAMLAWRGLATGTVFLVVWFGMARGQPGPDLGRLFTRPGLTVILSHGVNVTLFSFAVALAPVSVVLFAVATIPIFAAILGWLVAGEETGAAAWIAASAVVAGIGIAVFGKEGGSITLEAGTLVGALAALGVAAAMATTFVTIRHNPDVPILPAMGSAAFVVGGAAAIVVGPATLVDGNIWAALVSAVVILPASFAALSYATRHTAAVNVSLLLLLETILGPAWVWIGAGEPMGRPQIVGGVIVIISLTLYILHASRRSVAA